jgi:GxxExxY protein
MKCQYIIKEELLVNELSIFFLEDKIMVELKAFSELNDIHIAQAFNYLEASGMEIGLLINFGSQSLQFKRLHNKKLIHP